VDGDGRHKLVHFRERHILVHGCSQGKARALDTERSVASACTCAHSCRCGQRSILQGFQGRAAVQSEESPYLCTYPGACAKCQKPGRSCLGKSTRCVSQPRPAQLADRKDRSEPNSRVAAAHSKLARTRMASAAWRMVTQPSVISLAALLKGRNPRTLASRNNHSNSSGEKA